MSLFTLEMYSANLLEQWGKITKAKTGWFTSSIDLSTAAQFIVSSLDEAINYAETNMKDSAGSDKKAFVLNVISRIYDTTISPNLPLILYPFSSIIKSIIVDKVLPFIIDWIVQKYSSGAWKNENKT